MCVCVCVCVCGDRKAVRTFLHKRFHKDPVVRQIELRNPGVFGSNHAPFLLSMGT